MIGSTGPSHIYPSLEIIRELVARGHRVTYAIGEPLVGLVADTGAEPVAHPTILPPSKEAIWSENPIDAKRVFLDEAIAAFGHLTAYYDEDPPSLLLFDIGGMGGPLLGKRYGIPAVRLSPTHVAWKGFEHEPDMAKVIEFMYNSPSGKDFLAVLERWLTDNGVQQEGVDWLTDPGECLSLIPKAMQPCADRIPSSVRFVGPCLAPARLADRSWTPPASGKRVLLVSFGTTYNDKLEIYRACVDAFTGSDWHVVMVVGQHVDPAELGPLPDSFEVHRSVSQLAVLAAASAFVTHAGMGSCTEALWFGVPMVAVPQAADQPRNAATLVELGVGKHLPAEEVTAPALRSAVTEMADSPEVAARLAELSAQARAQGGIDKAVAAIEAYLE
ncbi:macrolide family glycosyltransferase [Amycolatopsis nigrescens]|uniref:macrolide family glycosyltransferase n=1 Tax=Amycolatopsis nigrescens TaxID=381445 RepID=UPI00037DE311|nr:macrolide family glycosyltransferase [Amycolatopsis nigrescens]